MTKNSSTFTGRVFLAVSLVLWLTPRSTVAQKIEPKQLNRAVERSEKSAKVLKTIAELPHSGIPRELIDAAHAVGVFPHVVTAKLIFEQLSLGYGVISRRNPAGWSLPAFYVFSGAGIELNLGGEEAADIILLFMSEKALGWFQKGRVQMKGEKRPTAGLVEPMTDEQRTQLASANIIAYALYKGILVGTGLGGGFFKNFLINPDNNLNKPLYGVKGLEVLAGKEIDPQSVPAGINAFQQALREHYNRQHVSQPPN